MTETSEHRRDTFTEESVTQNYARIQRDVPGVLVMALFDASTGQTRFVRSDNPDINLGEVGVLASELMANAARALSVWDHNGTTEDAVITTSDQLHVIRRNAREGIGSDVLVYVIADRFATNLAVLRAALDLWK